MKVNKIVRLLRSYLDKDSKRGRQDLDAIDELLKRLEERRDQLRHKLLKQKPVCKQKRLKTELKIVEMKLKKGRKRREALAKDKKK
ncbi:MAG: hypothetical protein G8D61_14690 [gamma proteobacterium symbiont of Ctena orbiculata]